MASFVLNAFSCHSIETLMNLVTVVATKDMCNSHVLCVLLISTNGRNIGYANERRKDSATRSDTFIFYPVSNKYDWAVFKHIYLSFCELGKKRKHDVHIRKSGSYEKGSSIYCDYRVQALNSKKFMFKPQLCHLPTVWP